MTANETAPNGRITVPEGEPVPVGKGSHVYLVDGSGYIFRAFHALPPLTRPSDGLPVGAVHGFCAMLWKLIQDAKAGRGPTHIAVIFDASRTNYRNDIYPDYKANRPPAPEELVPQFPLIRAAVKAFNIASIEQEGFEADDLIATYARKAVEAGGDVTIVSSDKDLMQLIKPGILMLDTMKGKTIGHDEVIEKFGLEPACVVDIQARAGDSTDNVPGVPGIGIKTAAELIREYGDLDSLLARAGEIKQPKRREKLIEFAEQARMSRELVRLKDDVPIEVSVEQLGLQEQLSDPLLTFMRTMEFNTLTKRVAEALGVEAPPPLERSVGSSVRPSTASSKEADDASAAKAGAETPAAAVEFGRAVAREPKIDRTSYETVRGLARLEAWVAEAREAGHVAFDTETTGLDAMTADLVGFSLATEPGKACYVP
ncbi:MAG: DNA polymerase I, partial [Hyphomicrobium sp.]|nr:DNA polymerase I [Hyphomicrobium sp.]